MNPKKNPLARRQRRRLPETTMTHLSPKGERHRLQLFARFTYSKPARLLNGNGSYYDPVAEDAKKGSRQ
jgi:hypothetical protein